MKYLIMFMLLATTVVQAEVVEVNCSAPAGFAGTAARIQGVLKVSNKPADNGYYLVRGNLKVLIAGSTREIVFRSEKVAVGGVILDDGALHMEALKIPEISAIYVNPNRKNVSYVELDGEMYISNCAK